MKILAIRGENIASLAAPFELDFVGGELAHSGLFAISGPTGSGKSSILDAMCLALFNETPRLSNSGGPAIGSAEMDPGDRVRANSVRGLLTRGAGSGFAEVDFRGIDGVRYRSRWSVIRARKRPCGRLQNEAISLENLDTNQSLGGTKKETLEAIQEALGLDFGQFRRAVLLAQGDFAAFLQAKASDRGELLEQMTGTAMYARISKVTFQRAKFERDSLAGLRQRLELVGVLDEEGRKALDREVKKLRKDVAGSVVACRALEKAKDWYERDAHLKGMLAAAEGELKALLLAWSVREPEAWEGVDVEDVSGIEAFLQENKAKYKKAVKLDAKIDSMLRLVQSKVEGKEELEGQILKEEELLQAAQDREAATKEEVEDLLTWLSDRASIGPVAEAWSLHEKNLQDFREAAGEVEEAKTRAVLLVGRLSRVVAENAKCARDLEGAKKDLSLAREEVATAQIQVDAISVEANRENQRKAQVCKEALTHYAGLIDRHGESTEEIGLIAKKKKCAEKAKLKAEQDLGEVNPRLEQAEDDLKRAVATLGFEEHRSGLIDGEPCPLCGAEEHPYSADYPSVARILEEQEKAVEGLKDKRMELVQEQAKEKRAAQSAAEALETAEDRVCAINTDGDTAAKTWKEIAGEGDGSLPPLSEAGAKESVKGIQKGVDERVEAADKQIKAFAERSLDLRKSRQKEAQCQSSVDNEIQRAKVAEEKLTNLRAETKEVEQIQQASEKRQLKAVRSLEEVFQSDDWRDQLVADPEGFLLEQENHVKEWKQATAKKSDCEKRLPVEAKDSSTRNEGLLKLKASLNKEDESLVKKEEELRVIQDSREIIFGGEPVEEVSNDLECIRDLMNQRAERRRARSEHLEKDAPQYSASGLEELLEKEQEKEKERRGHLSRKDAAKAMDEANLKKQKDLAPEIDCQEGICKWWNDLDGLIGQASGSKFRDYAQGLTLRIVLNFANEQLRQLRPRYELMAVPDCNLDMQIIDHDMADEVRAISSLSGGETFLVSLALALGLAESTGKAKAVGSLFIDEGFGTLDGETLEIAIATLDSLQATGRTIGVISHVDGLADRLGVRVNVSKVGAGRSVVEIQSPLAVF